MINSHDWKPIYLQKFDEINKKKVAIATCKCVRCGNNTTLLIDSAGIIYLNDKSLTALPEDGQAEWKGREVMPCSGIVGLEQSPTIIIKFPEDSSVEKIEKGLKEEEKKEEKKIEEEKAIFVSEEEEKTEGELADAFVTSAQESFKNANEQAKDSIAHLFALQLNVIQAQIHETAVEKGWWDKPRNKGEAIALMHSELSEALEGIRKDLSDDKIPEFSMEEAELADTMIRIMDYAVGFKLRLGEALVAKMKFNRGREKMHGGKKF